MSKIFAVLVLATAACSDLAVEFPPRPGNWRYLAAGIEIAEFQLPPSPLEIGDGVVRILRVDPEAVGLEVICANQRGHDALPADEWAGQYGLSVVVNAGMFGGDGAMTHVGFLKNELGVQSALVRDDYFSVFGCGAGAGVHDVDELGRMDEIGERYPVVVQNLRLIKRPGENRWTKQEKRWSECALGQDGEGRLLLIFCRTPYSMHELIEHLLGLPIDLRCAQHLEGGPEASLFANVGGVSIRETGSYETGFYEYDDHREFMELPNVIGITSKGGR